MSNITCDKEKVNEMKLHMLMLMNACAHEMQVPNAILNTRVLHFQSTRYLQGLRHHYDKNVLPHTFQVGDLVLKQIQNTSG